MPVQPPYASRATGTLISNGNVQQPEEFALNHAPITILVETELLFVQTVTIAKGAHCSNKPLRRLVFVSAFILEISFVSVAACNAYVYSGLTPELKSCNPKRSLSSTLDTIHASLVRPLHLRAFAIAVTRTSNFTSAHLISPRYLHIRAFTHIIYLTMIPSSQPPGPTGLQRALSALEPGTLPRVMPTTLAYLASTPQNAVNTAIANPFSAETFVWMLQSGLPQGTIERYLRTYGRTEIIQHIDDRIQGYPPIYFAIERNSPFFVRFCLDHSTTSSWTYLPATSKLLVYFVLNAKGKQINAAEVLIVLLARGASPEQIPSQLWKDYMQDPRSTIDTFEPRGTFIWCSKELCLAIAEGLHLTLRYLLKRASELEKPQPWPRTKQITNAFGISRILEVPYCLVGQDRATQSVIAYITSHFLLYPTESKPLTIMFAEPSGHGKTELARTLGKLLDVESLVVDCTEMKHETDLFGPKHPFVGSEKSSPLNLFLERNAGNHCVVFLDELDKTGNDVRNALLLPFESGTYRNRKNNQPLDCTKTIWICATNIADPIIDDFFTSHLENKTPTEQKEAPFYMLDRNLRAIFIAVMGAPFTGRISTIIPFFPFQRDEQAVIAHLEILKVAAKVRVPIDVKNRQLIGHLNLGIEKDGEVCHHRTINRWRNIALR